MDHRDLSKRLTEEQCMALFNIMKLHTYGAIIEVLNYAAKHENYDPEEVKIFIRNHFEASAFLSENIIDSIAREQVKQFEKEQGEQLVKELKELAKEIDFPNSKSSENK